MPFDVEKTMIKKPADGFKAPHRRAIKSVNLMCYLLGSTTYCELYSGYFGPVLKRIKRNASLLAQPGKEFLNVGAYSTTYRIQPLLYQALSDIAQIGNIENVVLKKLFSYKFASGTPEKQLTDRLNQLYTDSFSAGNCQLEHFCCPFLYYQGPRVAVLDCRLVEQFLAEIGGKTMEKMFKEQRKSYTEAQKTQIELARKTYFILTDKTPRVPPASASRDDIKPRVFPPSNGMRCDGEGKCEESTDEYDWCNDAGGSCSGYSSP